MKLPELLHWPMHFSEPGEHEQEPTEQLSPMEQLFPQRPQLLESWRNALLSTQVPLHHSWPIEQPAGPEEGFELSGGV